MTILQRALNQALHDDSLVNHPLWELVILQLVNVPVTIAPERQNEGVMDAWKKITLRTRDVPGSFRAFATRASNAITVDSGMIDGLWCMAAACYAFQESHERQAREKDLTQQPLILDEADPIVDIGFEYITAALGVILNGIPVPWGALPTLSNGLALGTRQLTLSAFGYVLYHEFAHLILAHHGTDAAAEAELSMSREQETDADNFAIDHILSSKASDNDLIRHEVAFRAWGVVIATLTFAAREVARNAQAERTPGQRVDDVTDRTHPLGYVRLDRVLKHQAVSTRPHVAETICTAACVPLYLLAVSNGAIDSLHAQTFRDMEALYEEIADLLHEQLQRLPKNAKKNTPKRGG